MGEVPTAVVCDDAPGFRALITALLTEAGLDVVAEVEDVEAGGREQGVDGLGARAVVVGRAEAVLERDERPPTAQRLGRPAQDLLLRALDVDLDEGDRQLARERAVERLGRDPQRT